MCGCKQKDCNNDCKKAQPKTVCGQTLSGDVIYDGEDIQIADGVYLAQNGDSMTKVIENIAEIIQLINP